MFANCLFEDEHGHPCIEPTGPGLRHTHAAGAACDAAHDWKRAEVRPGDLERAVLLHVCKDGTVTFRTRDEPVFNGVALPVYSVDTKKEAKAIRVLLCTRVSGTHPLLPNEPWYKVQRFSGDLDELGAVAARMRSIHALFTERAPTS